MAIRELEEKLKEDEQRIYSQCDFHTTKLINLQRQLLHLTTVFNLVAEAELDEIRNKLKTLFVNFLYIRNVHYVSFFEQCEYQSFWEKKHHVISIQDGPVLFCRRSTGTIDSVENINTLVKLGAKNKLVVKCLGKFAFIYIEFEQQQPIIDFSDIPASIQFLQFLFDLYQEEQISDFSAILLKMTEWFSQNLKNLIQKILNNYCRTLIDNATIIVPNNPLLSLLLSRMYAKALLNISFTNNVIFRGKTLKKQGQRFIFKDGKLLYTFNLNLTSSSIESLSKITLQQMLFQLNINSRNIESILEKTVQQGNHFSTNKSWSISTNLCISAFEIVVTNKRVSRKVDINQCRIMKELMSQGLKNLQSTIGNQFIPELEQTRLKGHKKTTKKVTNSSITPLDIGQSIKISFDQKIDLKKLKEMEFNILDYSVNSVANFASILLIDRFKQMKFSEDKLHNFISKVAFSYQKRNNPFHNFHHGFTVLHGAYIFSLNKFFQSVFNNNVMIAFLVSALCHDLDHTGFTNSYEQKIESKLANRFGDRSILQNNSIARALHYFSMDESNFLSQLKDSDWKMFRKLLVSSILATDNKHHTIVVSDFDAIITQQKNQQLSQNSIQKLLGAFLHCCDFWGNVKPYTVSKLWSQKINKQFSNQYEKQIDIGVEPTPYFKELQNLQIVAKNQNVFISAIVYPLYKKIDDWMEGFLQPCLRAIEKNLRIWKKIEEGQLITSIQNIII